MEAERLVAGLRCRDVLADLSEYLDNSLDPAQRARIEAHLRGCDNCERFGRRFGGAIKTLREQLGAEPALDPGIAGRLKARLRQEGS